MKSSPKILCARIVWVNDIRYKKFEFWDLFFFFGCQKICPKKFSLGTDFVILPERYGYLIFGDGK